MKLADIMKMFSDELELEEPLRQDDTGSYQIPIGDRDIIYVSHVNLGLESAVYLYAIIGPYPKGSKREELVTLLMSNNLFSSGTEGAVIGMDPDRDRLILSLSLLGEQDYAVFHDRFEDFLNTLDFWRSKVKEYEGEASSAFFG
jgi:hypothetical protein